VPAFSLMVRLRSERFRKGRRAATVMENVPGISGKQQNIAGFQLQRPATGGIIQQRRSADNSVIRDFADLSWTLLDAPGRAIDAAQIDPAAHRHHLEKVGRANP
jgi:hypothetical protein